MWSDECIVEFQGCFRFAKMELTIHKAYEFARLATYIGYVGRPRHVRCDLTRASTNACTPSVVILQLSI